MYLESLATGNQPMKKKNATHPKYLRQTQFLSMLIVMVISITIIWNTYNTSNSEQLIIPIGDKLAYTVNKNDRGGYEEVNLMLYDTATGENSVLIENFGGGLFSYSSDGRIAYGSFILDTNTQSNQPVNISDQLVSDDQLLVGWSPDSRYLGYQTNGSLYLWDGKMSIDITPHGLKNRLPYKGIAWSWSPDGRLAFAIAKSHVLDAETEIYLWDGRATVNLSQNPSGYDGNPAWSPDGRLAFYSSRDEHSGIWIWDGKSYRGGLPDTDSFTSIDSTSDSISWTPDNRLILDAVDRGRRAWHQVHMWDGKTMTNIIQLPNTTGYGARWSPDGRWAFISSRSKSKSVIYVRDSDNNDLVVFNGRKSLAWSNNGYLAYSDSVASFSLWDGQETIQLAEDTWVTVAQWQSGASIYFVDWTG
jgi:Tol biopolymer transport system component